MNQKQEDDSKKKVIDLLSIFKNVVGREEPLFLIKSKFINILKEHSSYKTSLSKKEVGWIINNLDMVDNIYDSKKACLVLWHLHRRKESFIQEIGRELNSYASPVKYWVKSLQHKCLIESRVTTYKSRGLHNKVYYYLNTKEYPNIIGTLIFLIQELL